MKERQSDWVGLSKYESNLLYANAEIDKARQMLDAELVRFDGLRETVEPSQDDWDDTLMGAVYSLRYAVREVRQAANKLIEGRWQ